MRQDFVGLLPVPNVRLSVSAIEYFQSANYASLLLRCTYPTSTSKPRDVELPAPPFPPSAPGERAGIDEESLAYTLLQGLADTSTARLHHAIVKHSPIFRRMVQDFFFTVHRWLPILNQSSILSRLLDLQLRGPSTTKKVDETSFVTLVTCICLLAQSTQSRLQQLLYAASKRLYWGVQPMVEPALEAMQAGVLLAVYEYGQGRQREAYMTIQTCLTTVELSSIKQPSACGLAKSIYHHAPSRALWAALLMERYAGRLSEVIEMYADTR